jgi:uncharacterized protein
MSRTFQGRPVLPGSVQGRALVSRLPFDALASFKQGLQGGRDVAIACDPDNAGTLGATLTGSILCLPQAVGSTSAGTTWDLIACRHLEPAALLFAERIDSLSAGGLVVARIWDGSPVVVVDRLGDSFLQRVTTGLSVAVSRDGLVTIS